MKTKYLVIILTTVGSMIYSCSVSGQKAIKVKTFSECLPNIELEEKTPQVYQMISNNHTYDLYGNFTGKTRITGEYTRGLTNDSVRWNNVRITNSQNLNEPFNEGERQDHMENFSYVVSEEIKNETFFQVTPETDIQLKTLVWDIFVFETFAWTYWDSLKLNCEYSARKMNSAVQIDGIGTIENKDLRITWTGITKKNGKLCAMINFTAMNNPLNFSLQNTEIDGRSHHWGTIYVSLTDKQIEFGELHQDIVMDIRVNGQESRTMTNNVRNICLEKIQ